MPSRLPSWNANEESERAPQPMNTDQEKFTRIVLQAWSESVRGMEDSAWVILGILLVLLFLGALALSACCGVDDREFR
jgi:hypothetical protein